MDMERDYFVNKLEPVIYDKKSHGYRAPGRKKYTSLDDILPDPISSGVTAELTGAIPARLDRRDEFLAYQEMFPPL